MALLILSYLLLSLLFDDAGEVLLLQILALVLLVDFAGEEQQHACDQA